MNVTADHLTTSNNEGWGVGVFVSKLPPNGVGRGSDHVAIDASTSSFGEMFKIFAQDEAGLVNTNITVSGFEYEVKNPAAAGYTFYLIDRPAAISAAFLAPDPMLSTVKNTVTGRYEVDLGLSIQTAVNASASGATVDIAGGIYDESVTIQKDIYFATVDPILLPPSTTPTPGLIVRDLTIDNLNGFTLLGMLGVNGTLTFVKGNINATSPNSLTLGASATMAGESGTAMVLGELVVRKTSVPAGTVETFGGIGLEVSGIPADLGLSRIVRTTDRSVGLGGEFKSVSRIWEVEVANPATVDMKFSWFASEDNGNLFNAFAKGIVFSSTDGSVWTKVGTPANVSGASTRSIAVTLEPGKYFTTGSADAPLPVELSNFTCTPSGKNVLLAWSTATEKNNHGFEIERRAGDAQSAGMSGNWQKVAFVEGAGTSNAVHSYHYSDAVTAGRYEYRLKQIDRDGSYEYSKVLEARVAFTAEDYGMTQNYPNPFNPATTIRFAVNAVQHATVKVFNSLGQEVRTLFNETAQPQKMYSIVFDATGLPSGTYYYLLRTADRKEVKRMTLVK
ncbi:MAG TPA: T9SS type A sorting domain-containing protein [Bacteroidota bacterium]|nr:T9SS type A sorting domain-containing protein [Bacteroidota bacterium]